MERYRKQAPPTPLVGKAVRLPEQGRFRLRFVTCEKPDDFNARLAPPTACGAGQREKNTPFAVSQVGVMPSLVRFRIAKERLPILDRAKAGRAVYF